MPISHVVPTQESTEQSRIALKNATYVVIGMFAVYKVSPWLGDVIAQIITSPMLLAPYF